VDLKKKPDMVYSLFNSAVKSLIKTSVFQTYANSSRLMSSVTCYNSYTHFIRLVNKR